MEADINLTVSSERKTTTVSNASGGEPALRGRGRGLELQVTHLKEASPLVLLRICIPNSLKNSGKIKILSEKKCIIILALLLS